MSHFDWCDDEDIAIQPQPAIAVYLNRAGSIVIRQEGPVHEDHLKAAGVGPAQRLALPAPEAPRNGSMPGASRTIARSDAGTVSASTLDLRGKS
jgi:hypothetical protein